MKLKSIARRGALALGVLSYFALAQANPQSHPAVQRALGLLKQHGQAAQAVDADQFQARDVVRDTDGSEHVRLDRKHKGLRVIGGDLVVHMTNKGQFKGGPTHTMKKAIQIDTVAQLDEAGAIAVAEQGFAGQRNAVSQAELVVYARSEPMLAYDVRVSGDLRDGSPSEMHFIVDAHRGGIIDKWDDIQTAAASGTAKSLFDGTVSVNTDSQSTGGYSMRDLARGGSAVNNMGNRTSGNGTLMTDADNVWGNFSTSDAATVAGDVAYGTAMTWDYFKNVHGRNGIANDGAGSASRVHFGRRYVNAFWNGACKCMSYGDGDGRTYYPLVAIDVIGHEMSHGVMNSTANLVYSGESGGINEASSDIFGMLIKFHANNPSAPGNYLNGEKLLISNTGVSNPTQAFRYMFKPSLDGASVDCYSGSIGTMDVHLSSGVANHFAYLLAEGAVVPSGFNLTPAQLVCNGNTALIGVGRDALGKIWYRALTVYMTSNTNYAGARLATLNAAADLYGANSSKYIAVVSAWSAVGVN
jgi:Zn-dependent metalloprotease